MTRHRGDVTLGGISAEVYIELMRNFPSTSSWLPPGMAAVGLLCAQGAAAQAFSADYGLSRLSPEFAESRLSNSLNIAGVRLGPAFQADTGYSGAGLSVAAGHNWFAQVSVGRSLPQFAEWSAAPSNADAVRIGGGYRWADGQTLSLHVTGARAPDRLGLSVNYDWPRYFVRLSYDTGINPAPQDRLRFSAGVRF